MWELGKILFVFVTTVFLAGYLLQQYLTKSKVNTESIFLIFVSGIIFFYLLILLQIPIGLLLIYFKITTVFVWGYLFYKLIKNYRTFRIKKEVWLNLFVLVISFLYLTKSLLKSVIYQPITGWDARSIWYFRAKQLFFNNGFSEALGICTEGCTTSFSHATYSIFIPSISAFICFDQGFWNEYLPKSNLLVLFFGTLLALISLKHLHIIFRLGFLIAVISINPVQLTSGYLDSWLGIYASLSILYLCEFIRSKKKEYLYTYLSCSILICYFKNEGILLSVCILIGFATMALLANHRRLLKYSLLRAWKIKYLLIILLVPLLFWNFYKVKFHYFDIDYNLKVLLDPQLWKQFFISEKYFMIHDFVIQQSNYIKIYISCIVAFALSIVSILIRRNNREYLREVILIMAIPLLTSIFFYLALCAVYYSSMMDLDWHLATSADRLREHLIYMSIVTFLYALYSIRLRLKIEFLED